AATPEWHDVPLQSLCCTVRCETARWHTYPSRPDPRAAVRRRVRPMAKPPKVVRVRGAHVPDPRDFADPRRRAPTLADTCARVPRQARRLPCSGLPRVAVPGRAPGEPGPPVERGVA